MTFCNKNHAHQKKVGTPQNFFWHLLVKFEKPKKSGFPKNDKNCWRYLLHVCTKNHNGFSVAVPDIQSETDVFVILGHCLPFYPPSPQLPPPIPHTSLLNNPENQNFEKMKTTSGDGIILNLCNKKQKHMMYVYSNM